MLSSGATKLPLIAPLSSKFLVMKANGHIAGVVWLCTLGRKSKESRRGYRPTGALDSISTLDAE